MYFSCMERLISRNLNLWKLHSNRKPLIIKGARQVGKTWIMKDFAKREFSSVVYVNFERDRELKGLFEQNYDITRIISTLEVFSSTDIEPGKTVIILDEIQEVKGGLTSLKYFYEEKPELHIMAAGSLLGLSIHKDQSFPVGKVEILDLHPLNFIEFLMACNEGKLIDLIVEERWEVIVTVKAKYIALLKHYYFVGGMPDAVSNYIQGSDLKEVRQIQRNILNSYELDFSKYADSRIIPRIKMIWENILPQLSKENKKFMYGALKTGARAKDYEEALIWLENYGLVHRVSRVKKANFPLKSYEDMKAFKLYVHDIGLLNAKGGLSEKVVIDSSSLFNEFKGSLTEQFVLQQFISRDTELYYWSENTAELDFLMQDSKEIIGMEVKASENLKAKSLKVFKQKYPEVSCLRLSLSDYREEDWLTNRPLYSV